MGILYKIDIFSIQTYFSNMLLEVLKKKYFKFQSVSKPFFFLDGGLQFLGNGAEHNCHSLSST